MFDRHPENDWLYAYVHARLRDGWSPGQISGRLKRDYPGEKTRHINHETIYRYIYAEENQDERLWEYLPRKQNRRRKQTGRNVHRSRIPNRVSIHERPVTVEERTEFGHFEGDSIEGRRVHKDGIHTEVERVSRKLFARKVDRIASRETTDAQLAIFESVPAPARRSTTLDNGKEHCPATELSQQLGIAVYFADPCSSWQRGSNEYHNGLLRRYLPKRTDFTALTQDELDDIVEEINNRPRKCLDYATPNEVFSEELTKAGVRIESRV
jgi:IS30 family transposase